MVEQNSSKTRKYNLGILEIFQFSTNHSTALQCPVQNCDWLIEEQFFGCPRYFYSDLLYKLCYITLTKQLTLRRKKLNLFFLKFERCFVYNREREELLQAMAGKISDSLDSTSYLYKDQLSVRAGLQNVLQIFVTNAANVFLLEVSPEYPILLEEQVEMCKRVLNIYRYFFTISLR